MSKLLVIGNGFDLAHNKKTSYNDFLDFIVSVIRNPNDKLSKEVIDKFPNFEESSLLCFLRYFYERNVGSKNWIDMETEICNFINNSILLIEEMNNQKQKSEKEREIFSINLGPFSEKQRVIIKTAKSIFEEKSGIATNEFYVRKDYKTPWEEIDIKRVIKKYDEELKEIKDIIYFYLDKVECEKRKKKVEKIDYFNNFFPDKVISFNYTSTCSELYGIRDEDICYIHGRVEDNNIVLGYSDIDGINSNVDLIFKKYFQRIENKTDLMDDYINKVFYSQEGVSLYFFGHSLDISDKDILCKLLNIFSDINIYYYNDKDKRDKIECLFKLLGKEKAERRLLDNEIKLYNEI